jgi:hypothetical protein
VLYGSPTGITDRDQLWTMASDGVPGSAKQSRQFGSALAVGDFNNDGRTDLGVGAPGGKQLEDTGSLVTLYGGRSGLTAAGARQLDQDSSGIAGHPEPRDQFGAVLFAVDLGQTPATDLLVGVFGEDAGSTDDAGAVEVLYGRASGLSGKHSQFLTEDSTGMKDSTGNGEAFGHVGGTLRRLADRGSTQ